MPGFNQTGPMGQGPLTGRRMGRCTNYGTTGKYNDTTAPENQTEREPENFTGRGFGFGRGRGGRGRGMGFRNRFGGRF
jgi:hypothetical protein